MATNTKYEPLYTRTFPVASGVTSGKPCIVGDQGLSGVAITDRASDGTATVGFGGQALVNVTTSTTLDVGDKVFIIAATGVLTTTDNSGANPLFGWAAQAKGAAAADILVEVTLP